MKVLFAVNNDSVSEAIVKKYQKEYKEILSYKNVYYFNAILRELQKDKSYSRIVISEDLEPFANNNYDSIDKFLFEKYSNIVEEAKSINNERIDIILICADRRKKTDYMLVKLYKKNIYNAIVGQDRSIDEVCRLINNPRDKEAAKAYYGIQESELGETESENSVSEAEVENIIAHYARLGKNEDKYLESFNNIVAQYTDTQLKIIIKYLPMNVKAVLEERSPKYQQLVTISSMDGIDAKRKTASYKEQIRNRQESDRKTEDDVVKQLIKPRTIKSVVIPTNLKTHDVQKVVVPTINKPEINTIKNSDISIKQEKEENFVEKAMKEINPQEVKEKLLEDNQTTIEQVSTTEEETKTQKRGRGRPRKNPLQEDQEQKPKRGRGRPKKQQPIEETVVNEKETENDSEVNLFDLEEEKPNEEVNLFDLEEEKPNEEVNLFELEEEKPNEEVDLFDLEEEKPNEEANLFDLEEERSNEEANLFDLEEEKSNEEANLFELEEEKPNEEVNSIETSKESEKTKQEEQDVDLFNSDEEKEPDISIPNVQRPIIQNKTMYNNIENNNYITRTSNPNSNFNTLLTADKKIVAFVGTTKNGTSFIVNNTAEMLSTMGINTAILDMTKTKNAYYIYTNNEESLRNVAKNCMENLQNGVAEGIKPHKNLSIYTEMPGDEKEYEIETILSTLLENYSAILIDTDFDTPPEIFSKVQEIYLVQTMDVLTIQPLTAFLRELKSKSILRPEKLKIIINKSEKVRSLSIKTLIGGMSCYNSPSMTYMTELFNKDNIRYCEIPFEVQNYVKYLDSLVKCEINLNGYTKQFMIALRELSNMVYPLINRQEYSPIGRRKGKKDPFSNQVNDTLNKMRNRY